MTLSWKIVIDCADPHAQAAFWSAALGYTVEDNSVLIEQHAEVARLRELGELGATVIQEVREPGTEHVVMSDPESNEFCVQ